MTPVYHVTHVSNLPGMLADGGLTCVAKLRQRGASAYRDIAYPHIQDRRANKGVPCGPGGTLADYVPFYFAPRSPMLYTIWRAARSASACVSCKLDALSASFRSLAQVPSSRR